MHEVIATHSLRSYDEQYGWVPIPFSLCLSKCRTCNAEALYSIYDDDGEATPLWPDNLDLGKAVPEDVKNLYVEANAVKSASTNAYAVLIRKALEAICVHQNASGRNLSDQLRSLTTNLGLPTVVEDAVRATRLIGNMGAHYGKSEVSKAQVEAINEFFRGIVEYVYTAPARLAHFNQLLGSLPEEAGGPSTPKTP